MAAVTQGTFDAVHGVKEAAICNSALVRIGADRIRDTDPAVDASKQASVCREMYSQCRDELLRKHSFRFAAKTAMVPIDEDFDDPLSGYSYAYKLEDWRSFTGVNDTSANITGITGQIPDASWVGRIITGTYIPEGATVISVGTDSLVMDRASTDEGTTFEIHIDMARLDMVGANVDALYEDLKAGDERRLLTSEPYVLDDNDDPFIEIKYVERVKDPDKFDDLFREALVTLLAFKIAIYLVQKPELTSMLEREAEKAFHFAKSASLQEKELEARDTEWTDRSFETV